MKKLLNDPRATVREMLEGQVDLNPGQALLAEADVVVRADLPPPGAREVAVLSGGGSGHEPAHAGYVGPGMLHAAVAGDVFTSPGVDAVLAGIRAAAGPAGALLVVKNYTGDRLNFGLAAELARGEGMPVEIVVVADDVALHGTVEPARRRGIAGTVLVHKVAGAAAAAGLPLAAVAAEARAAAEAMGSMGVALGACTVPAAGRPGFTLGEAEIELGLGIHGEQGVRRGPLRPADALVAEMLETILADRGLAAGARVALLVNGLGGTPPMELAVVARAALALLRGRGLVVERAWSGTLLSALEMPGVSLTVLPVDDGRLARLDAPSAAPAWPGSGRIAPSRIVIGAPPMPPEAAPQTPTPEGQAVRRAALAAATALEAAEARLTELDSAAGDGDLGLSMTRGAAAVRALPEGAWADAPAALHAMGEALRRAIAGSSGPFYATALLRAARALPPGAPSPQDWARAFAAGVAAIAELGGAQPGDRTMLDALHPAARRLGEAVAESRPLAEAWREAVAAARQGAEATAGMRPRLGRASYLGERAMGVPDAGAVAALTWMEALGG
ncbi:dihydroxyacetone kinase family protein [Paracraurococcus ruber]|uniref:Dihydroxyacetone kinase n=1 Tax=Paracraurococcus ruber TaxID=77675 RepID=A0ABS1CSB4_9PROT|nr:dihydroxyacetone kinase family protein [Paracraurococcus ruber]MBK1657356.1 dihydroxyacetone kinase [Paracraurococcus ruber]TDG34024.1 DAK2 domain-containing protein [Paracraurococcus ruber]